MATIGTFTQATNGSFAGTIKTEQVEQHGAA